MVGTAGIGRSNTVYDPSIHFSGKIVMSINKVRSVLYRIARILGDFNAVSRGKTSRRIGRRMAGKVTGRWLSRLFE